MFNVDPGLFRHGREFLRALRNHKYERTDAGIFFPAAHAVASGMYVHDVNGLDEQFSPNILPTESLNRILDVHLGTAGSTTQLTSWYCALYSGAVTPGATMTAANFTSTTTEITSGSEGYTESTRVLFVPAAASAGAKSNSASKAAFTIATATTLTVNGCGLLSASAKGSTSGVIASATRFASARSLSDTDVFNLGYTLSLTSS